MSTRLKRAIQILGGVVVGLCLMEAVFYVRDDGAFPHVAFYVEDEELGVRLRPHASQRIAFGGNPTTTIDTNSRGYRGTEWPAPAAGEVVVVGDSQVYGLGVEADETFSAALAKATGRPVINAGVPTYGPDEYAAVVDELLKERKPSHVVFVVNLANDLFEATRPNVQRHAVWDGWAVRKETAPVDVVEFPGRALLMSRSHLVFAMRALLEERESAGAEVRDEPAFPSEGNWRDLTRRASARAELAAAAAAGDDEDERVGALRKRPDAAYELELAEAKLDRAAERIFDDDVEQATEDEANRIAAARGSARDIVIREYAESGRFVHRTASILLAAAKVRRDNEEALRAWLVKHPDDAELRRLLDEKTALEQRLDALASPAPAPLQQPSALRVVLDRVRARTDAAGARLIVVALPLDVMVSETEWAKYAEQGAQPLDMAPAGVLVDEVLDDAKDAGAVAFDARPSLKQAEPGAFLDKDLHMSPKGHAALGEALVKVLDELPPLALPRAGLPPRRSHPPTKYEWGRVVENTVKGSSAAACETKQIREWLKVSCHKTDALTPVMAEILEGGHGDAMHIAAGTSAVVTVPVLPGERVVARFHWQTHTQKLIVDWPADAVAPTLAFGEREPLQPLPPETKLVRAVAAESCDEIFEPELGTIQNCDQLTGVVDGPPAVDLSKGGRFVLEDAEVFGKRVKGTRGLVVAGADYRNPPPCADGYAHAGAAQRCAKLCDRFRPCQGTGERCEPWMGAGFCRAP